MLYFSAVLILASVYFLYWRFSSVRLPVLHCSLNEWNDRIISECPSLHRPYSPSFWCFNRHIMLAVLMFREYRSEYFPYDLEENLKMKDGGLTGLAWAGLHGRFSLDVPVAVIFHTISGDEQDMKGTVRYITDVLKWTAVVCIRRGHGKLPLTAPKINTMGSVSDLEEQLHHIQNRFPLAPLFGIGISAGSGLLARYLGEKGQKSLFTAAAAVSPAYDIEKAFHRIHPFYGRIMGQRIIGYFLKKHHEALSHIHGYEKSLSAKTLGEFQDVLHPIAGFDTKEEYYQFSNPIRTVHNIKTPLLILNAEDDPICIQENVTENLHLLENLPKTLLVQTRRGSHVAFYEGLKAASWSDRLVGEYFQAVIKTLQEKRKPPFPFTVGEYLNLTKQKRKVYEAAMPKQKIAVCPFCRAEYAENLDTFSLTVEDWDNRRSYGDSLFMQKRQRPCSHFLFVDRFLNFNGYVPEISETELRIQGTVYASQKPHLMSRLFEDESLGCRAVIHSFPIHKIIDNQFIPRYTLHTVVYYAPPRQKNACLNILRHYNGDAFLATPNNDEPNPDPRRDLADWVRKGKLFWMSRSNGKISIRSTVKNFPY